MKRLVVAVAAVGVLAGCTNAATSSKPDDFRVVNVQGYTCIVWSPYNGSGEGAQMECDFRR